MSATLFVLRCHWSTGPSVGVERGSGRTVPGRYSILLLKLPFLQIHFYKKDRSHKLTDTIPKIWNNYMILGLIS
jgi:hypothetical protein